MSDTDDAFVEELRQVVNQVDGLPEEVVTDAKAAFALRRAGDRLAALTFDSWAEPAAAGLRSSSAERHRQLSFSIDDVMVAFELDVTDRRIVGLVIPPRPVRVELRNVARSIESTCDEHGRFVVDDVPTGPASVRLVAADGDSIATEWLPL
jgi:hypothetical protein